VICPEGDCTSTENSPLPLRSGAFRLALHSEPEPLIVPITVADFDKRLARTTLTAVVHQPFRLSDQLPASPGEADLFRWMGEFQGTFARYVAEARDLAAHVAPAV
jgi:1-acyl-sn-glycerol-3-phosphate acyltransferase